MPSIFGSLATQAMAEKAVLATLNVWLDTYLAELERTVGLTVPTLSRPRAYRRSFDFDNWDELQLPAIVTVCPSPAPFDRAGGDRYNATFPIDVGVFISDQTEDAVLDVASTYQAAIGAALVQNGGLGGVASETNMIGWRTHLPDPMNRTLALAVVELHVGLDSILTGTAGPESPSPSTSTQYGGTPEAPFLPWWPVSTPVITIVGER